MKGVCLTNVLKAMDELVAEREVEEAKRKAKEREKEAKHDD